MVYDFTVTLNLVFKGVFEFAHTILFLHGLGAIDAAARGQAGIPSLDVEIAGDPARSVRLYFSAVGDVADDGSEAALVYGIDFTDQRALEEQFAKAHACEVIGVVDPQTTSTVAIGVDSANGGTTLVPVTTTLPSRIGYLCNDGITYWRNK